MEVKLELTEDEWEWVKFRYHAHPVGSPPGGEWMLIDFLLRLEAGRREARFWRAHALDLSWTRESEYRTWLPADWLAKVREEKLGGDAK